MDIEFIRHKYEDSYDGVITRKKFRPGLRHMQMIYMFICSLVMGSMRGSTGIAILALADHTRDNGSYTESQYWDKKIQGTVLSSFFIGYASVMVPAEIYLKNIGDKFIMTAVLLINGGLTAAMPTVVIKGGWIAVCNAQFVMGMTQACLSPINLNLLSTWLPPGERVLCGFFIQGAILCGTIIALPISGLLSESRLGWELIFYTQAMMTLSTAAIWAMLTSSTPNTHYAIGNTEKEFISHAISCYRKKKLQKPWQQILQTKQFWAIASAHTSANILFIFFLVEIPSFLCTMRFPIKISSTQSALPFVGMWVVYVLTSPIIAFAYRIGNVNLIFDVIYFRKIINSFASLGIVIGLVMIPYLIPSWNNLGFTLLVGILALLGIQFSGFLENHRDMTNNFSDTLLLMSSVVSSSIAALVPVVTGLVINNDRENLKLWKIVFLSLASFYTVCNAIYVLFASSDRQDWDRTQNSGKFKFGYCNALSNFELQEMNQSNDLDHKLEEDTSL